VRLTNAAATPKPKKQRKSNLKKKGLTLVNLNKPLAKKLPEVNDKPEGGIVITLSYGLGVHL
jgi:hypothetical protein